ncbi:histone acetyltransferase KAT5-like, partial [Tropilaelaps mercedesae]
MPTSSPAATELTEGCRVPVNMVGAEWPIAEVLSTRRDDTSGGSTLYYVHFVGYNKRLDEWVTTERIDFSRISLPKAKSTSGGGASSNNNASKSHHHHHHHHDSAGPLLSAGSNTLGSAAISRPSSPDLSALSAPATPESWPGGAPATNVASTPTTKENGLIAQKGSNRKRPLKIDEDSQDGPTSKQQTAGTTPTRPSGSGSLVAHNDSDIITRMKNIDMIELGKYRIRP